jgi:hypothetical protein
MWKREEAKGRFSGNGALGAPSPSPPRPPGQPTQQRQPVCESMSRDTCI